MLFQNLQNTHTHTHTQSDNWNAKDHKPNKQKWLELEMSDHRGTNKESNHSQ